MSPRAFPNPTAIFNDRFIFTSLWPAEVASHTRSPYCHPHTGQPCHLFTLDEQMRYTPFAMDHGPLNLAFTFQACVEIHTRLTDVNYQDDTICLYTSPEVTTKSNITLMAALYFLIVGHQTPSEVFHPIARMEVMPFRDAGNGAMDYALSIQDCLYGVEKAIKYEILNLHDFDPIPYHFYEQVDNGDLNILGPFIAFASPVETYWVKSIRGLTKTTSSLSGANRTTSTSFAKGKAVSRGFKNVLHYFREKNVGVVVRLNDELYDRRHFMDAGMDHVEMYFDDGTNPTDEIVRDFIALAEEYVERRKLRVAVHCKAGLGRTGVLIGAYLIYKYSFSAQEVIGYMRIVRPGMVVGPQQQYMMANQMKWVGWAARDQALREFKDMFSRETQNPLATPPHENDLPLLPLQLRSPNQTAREIVIDHLPLKTPVSPRSIRSTTPSSNHLSTSTKGGDAAGQPRKTPARSPLRAVEMIQSVDITIALPSPGLTSSDFVAQALTPNMSSPPPSTISPTDGSFSLTFRGTKRGLSRNIPGQSSSADSISGSPSAYPSLSIQSVLQRSTSSVSMTSTEERPPKKRTGQTSSLGNSGLSSPPPSRETSPLENVRLEEMDIVTPLPTRTPNKLQRPRPIAIIKAERSSPAPKPRAATDKEEAKGHLQVRRVVPPSPTKDLKYHRRESPAQTPSDTSLRKQPSLRSSASPQTKLQVPVKRESKRMLLTPPKFMGILAKISGGSPSY